MFNHLYIELDFIPYVIADISGACDDNSDESAAAITGGVATASKDRVGYVANV